VVILAAADDEQSPTAKTAAPWRNSARLG